MTSELTPRAATPEDRAGIRALQAKCFGPGRFSRTAYRIREARIGDDLVNCLVAADGDLIVGSVDLTAIEIAGAPAGFLLGPLGVLPDRILRGVGSALMQAALDAAQSAGARAVFLVGDLPFYERFGFEAVAHRSVTLPGPADPDRILCKRFDDRPMPAGAMRCAAPTPVDLAADEGVVA